MDEVGLAQQYYIEKSSSPADDLTRVLKYGKMFAVFDRHGDMGPSGRGEEGIFFQGTRYLSQLVVSLWDFRPLLLSSSLQADNFVFTADLANVDLHRDGSLLVPRDTIHLLRSKFLWQDVSYEEFKIVNYGLTPLLIPLRIRINADFADIFEVRGTRRSKRGRRLENEIHDGSVIMAYEGLDRVVRRTCIQCHPAPKEFSGSELRFHASLQPKEEAKILIVISDSRDTARTALPGYSSALSTAKAH